MSRSPFLTHATRTARTIWPALVILFVTFWLYRTVWYAPAGAKSAQWLGWDCIESYWPDLAYYAGALGHGEWPAWNPYDRGGYAFYGDTVTGLYYPLTWLFVGAGAAAGGMPGWAIELKALVQLAIGGITLYAFLRTRQLPRPAALLGGIVFVVSVPMIIHKASALGWPMVWAPLIWIAIDHAIEHARAPGWWRRAAALAGAIGLAGAAGPPPGFFYILVASLAYGGLRLGQQLADARGRGEVRGEAVAQARLLAVAAVATLALLGVVVLPGLAIAGESATRGETRDLGYALNTALPVGPTLAGLVSPPGGKVDAYLGVLVLALAAVGLGARPRADRWAPVLFFGVAAFALVLAFGGGTPVLPWLVKHVPGFGYFREPNRYKIVTAMCMAVVAAHGLAALLDADDARRRRALYLLGGTIAALLVAVLIIKSGATPKKNMPKIEPGWATSFAVLAAGGVLLAAIALVPARFRPALAAAVIGVCYFDVARFGYAFVNAREAPVDDQADRRFLADLGDVAREWRVYDEFVMEQRPGSRLRVRDLRGYPSGDPFDDARYADVRARLRKNPELVAAYNVRWVLWGPHHRNGTQKNHIAVPPDRTAPARFKKLDAKRWEVVDPAPLVMWYGAASLVPDKKAALEQVVAQEKQPGQRTRVIVEQADAPRAALPAAAEPAPPPIAGQLLSYGANRIAVTIDAPADGVVVLNEKMLNGWHATVDGRAADGFRANYMLRAVVVPAGSHTIVWTFSPPRYRGLLGAWAAGVAFVLVAGVSGFRRRRSVVASPTT